MQIFGIKSFQARRMTSINSLCLGRKNLCFRNRIEVIDTEHSEKGKVKQELRAGGIGKG